MGESFVKKCFGKFKYPKCLTQPCRHECVDKFNSGRKIKFALKRQSKKRSETKKIYKGVGNVRFDAKTVSKFITKVLRGIPLNKNQGVDVITWSYRNKRLIWLKKAKNQKVQIELINEMSCPGARVTKKKRISISVSLDDEIKLEQLKESIRRWFRNRN